MSDEMIILGILAQIIVFGTLLFVWWEYGQRISAWEARTWARMKEARRRRRRAKQVAQCRKLAEDGIYAVPPWAGGRRG